MHHYIAILWNSHAVSDENQILRSITARLAFGTQEWSVVYRAPGAMVLNNCKNGSRRNVYQIKNGAGIVLGALFETRPGEQQERALAHLDETESAKIVSTKGCHLIRYYWGSYVAVIRDWDTGGHHVIRDPVNTLPCFRMLYEGFEIFFSSVTDVVSLLPIVFTVDNDYLRRWLVFSGFMSRDCGLKNVENVLGGERLTVSAYGIRREIVWNPVTLAQACRFEHTEDASRTLRITVQSTVSAWASRYQNIALRLSGGIDSSILAGCLSGAASARKVTYVNFSAKSHVDERVHMPDLDPETASKLRALIGDGDERYFARLVSRMWNIPLIELERTMDVNLGRIWDTPPRPNPSVYAAAIDTDDAEIELVKRYGFDSFFSGHMGDSIFLVATHPLAAIDYAYVHGLSFKLWRHVVDAASMSKQSLWGVMKQVLMQGIARQRIGSLADAVLIGRANLLNNDILNELRGCDFESPWDRLASDLPPGKRDHLSGLSSWSYDESTFRREEVADQVDPLNSQPIWELMLQVPSHTILDGGISRGLARRSFSNLLPGEIKSRQVKGTGTPYYQKLFRANKRFFREVLQDGLLVKGGFLDRQKVDKFFLAEEPFLIAGVEALLCYVSAEVWLQQWTPARKGLPALSNSTSGLGTFIL